MASVKPAQGSVLFVCNLNSVRSPMAEALTRALYGKTLYVESAGLEPTERDPFAMSVLNEVAIDMSKDQPLDLEEIDVGSFDHVVCLTPEALARVNELVRGQAVNVEYWQTIDPFSGGAQGSREQRLTAYRDLREELRRMIDLRFEGREKAIG